MASVGTLTVEIAADIARLQADVNKARKRFNSLERTIRKSASAMAAMGVAVIAVKKAWDLMEAATKFDQQEQAFLNLAASHGANAEQIIKNLKMMSAETISTANIMQSAGTAMLLGIPAKELTKLMEIARASARITGQTVQAAFNDIAKGLGRQSKLILDNLGIVVDAAKANQEYAKTLNKTASALTDAERKQAFFNAAVESGQKIVDDIGAKVKTTAEAMAQFKATIENVSIFIGKVLVAAFGVIVGSFNLVAKWIFIATKAFVDFGRILSDVMSMAVEASKKGLMFIKDAILDFDASIIESVGKVWNGIKDIIESTVNGIINILSEMLEMGKDIPVIGEAFMAASSGVKNLKISLENTNDEFETTANKIRALEGGPGFGKGNMFDSLSPSLRIISSELTALSEDADKSAESMFALAAAIFATKEAQTTPKTEDTGDALRTLKDEQDVFNTIAAERAFALEREFELKKEIKAKEAELGFGPANELAALIEANEAKLEAIEEYEAMRLELARATIQDKTLLELESDKITADSAKRANKQKTMFALQSAQVLIGLAQQLLAASNSSSKRQFQINKGLGIASAIINTYVGVSKAIADNAYPYSIVVAGLTLAAGLAAVSKIASTSYGGGGGGGGGISLSGGGGGGGGGGGSASSGTVPSDTNGQGQATQNITIVIENGQGSEEYWQNLTDDVIIPAINDASDRNINLNIREI